MKDKILLVLFVIILLCKPISYEDVVRNRNRNQFVQQEVLVFRAGGQDSTEVSFVPQKPDSRPSISSGEQNPQPKL